MPIPPALETTKDTDYCILCTQDRSALNPCTSRDSVSADLSNRLGKVIWQEAVNIKESEKTLFVVIKGPSVRTPDIMDAEFAELTSIVMGCGAALTDIVKIKDHPDL